MRPAWVGTTPWRLRTSSAVPNVSSRLRMRVLAAPSARCARAAPCVMLPASTTSRNRFRSIKVNRIAATYFVIREVRLRHLRIAVQYVLHHPSPYAKDAAQDGTAQTARYRISRALRPARTLATTLPRGFPPQGD